METADDACKCVCVFNLKPELVFTDGTLQLSGTGTGGFNEAESHREVRNQSRFYQK